jgi:2-polyprenyl-3-methyl-5-hydroxy-6-metoxy-1,4-benzoquinol methylase/GT2 family glycosyltransferase/glycosyltransferase involved in cell wall biosynthesis
MDNKASRETGAGGLIRPLTVIVPIHNASEDVRKLVASLDKCVPIPKRDLSFLFADDGSSDPGLRGVWSLPFFQRPDVDLLRSADNVGFVNTVNSVATKASPDSDIVILNSDTRVCATVFEKLQEDAHSSPSIASVTPITNNGTIASIFAFPGGGELPPGVEPETVGRIVDELDLHSPRVWAPTGVGHCLYLKREAITALGMFDPIYGRGYGEESDWCQRARACGWQHLISTRGFVYHSGTRSFDVRERDAAIERNTRVVLSRYPEYLDDIQAYCARDPLRFHRLRILLEILRARSKTDIVLFALHSDPDGRYAGGTERHVRQLEMALADREIATAEIFPQGRNLRLRGLYQDQRYFDELFDQSVAPAMFELLSEAIGTLHAHHFRGWSEKAIDGLIAARFKRKLCTLHDFVPLCPSGFLLAGEQRRRFCEVETDLRKCNRCLESVIGYRSDSIDGYRAKWLPRVAAFDRILTPSRAVLAYWEKGLAASAPDLLKRIEPFEHDLAPLRALAGRAIPWKSERPQALIAFVGGFGKPKGSDLIIESAPALRRLGFDVEVVGYFDPASDLEAAQIRLTRYRTPMELLIWLQQNAPMIVAHPSLAAESFCFAFYECMLLCESAVPVVGPFGNPAALVRETGSGVVMTEGTSAALVSACELARATYAQLVETRARYRERLRSAAQDYPAKYLDLIDDPSRHNAAGVSRGIRRSDRGVSGSEATVLMAIEAMDFAARQSSTSNEHRLSPPVVPGVRMAISPRELERLTTDIFTMSSVEHLHRYALATGLSHGKDVLDIASGEGYGSNLLAQVASRVVGVDISSDSIAHAAAKYRRGNLQFQQGTVEAIPLDNASIDLVVSFETLEHHDRHEAMLREIKRVLRPNGLLIISTPDKLRYSDIPGYRNVYHVKELYLEEFRQLIECHFAHHRLLFQGSSSGTFVVPERDWNSFLCYRGDYYSCQATHRLPRHVYNIAVASDDVVPEIGPNYFSGEDLLQRAADEEEGLSLLQLKEQLRGQAKVIRDLERSLSYRIGRFLTWPLRKSLNR